MVCVAPAAEFAAKVTVPEVVPRSAATAASVLNGALHATCTSAATDFDSVTVKVASEPSSTLDVGPDMLSSAESTRSLVEWSVSVMSTWPQLTVRFIAVVPETVMVSSPSTTRRSSA